MKRTIVITIGDLVLVSNYSEAQWREPLELRWVEVTDVERRDGRTFIKVAGDDEWFDHRFILDWAAIAERSAS